MGINPNQGGNVNGLGQGSMNTNNNAVMSSSLMLGVLPFDTTPILLDEPEDIHIEEDENVEDVVPEKKKYLEDLKKLKDWEEKRDLERNAGIREETLPDHIQEGKKLERAANGEDESAAANGLEKSSLPGSYQASQMNRVGWC